MCGVQLTGFLDGEDEAPAKMMPITSTNNTFGAAPSLAYVVWLARDQQVLCYLLNSLSKDMLTQVVGMEHAYKVWAAIGAMSSSQSRSWVMNLWITLSNTKKGAMSTASYIMKIKSIGDELAVAS